MTDPSATAEQPHEIIHVDQGMSIGIAAAISIVSIVVVAGSTYAVVKGTLSGGMTRLLAVLALLSLVAAAYGLIELALAVVATTAERRRKARAVTERRQAIGRRNLRRTNKKGWWLFCWGGRGEGGLFFGETLSRAP